MLIQIVRRGDEVWELTRAEHVWDESNGAKVHEYELLARVIRDGNLYYVEFPDWKEESYVWQRQPRGYLIPRAALRVAAKGRKQTVLS